MKSIADLEKIRQKTLSAVNLRRESEGTRIAVGMATCGIAAGARPVMTAFIDEIGKRNMLNVVVAQTGCIGMCRYEPIVEVIRSGEEKVTYIKMTPEKALEVMEKHIKGGKPVSEYTIGNAN